MTLRILTFNYIIYKGKKVFEKIKKGIRNMCFRLKNERITRF